MKMWNCGVLLLCVCVMIRVSTSKGTSYDLTKSCMVFEDLDTDRHYSNKESMCPNRKTCARKCCPIGMGFDISTDECRAIDDAFIPHISKKFHILEGLMDCLPSPQEARKQVTEVSKCFHLQTDGTLFVESHRAAGPGLTFNTTKYCIDWFITADGETEWNAFICHVKHNFERHFILTGSCMLITCCLVLLRVVVFAWLPELRTLHGMILMAYLISFLVGFLLLGSKLLLMNGQKINREMCVVLSFIIYFFILSAFFWRNVMCYDIWWTFSGKRAKSGRGSNSRARLYLYCTHAIGGPTALTILLAVLEYSDLPTKHVLMPKLRLHGCNSLYGYSKLIYFYGPIVILFVINIVLFTSTALKISALNKATKMILKTNESGTDNRVNDKRRFTLYANLFAVMLFLEVNWILEIVTIFYPEAKVVLIISDLYTVGVLLVILINFLCRKQTWRMIIKRYKQIRGFPTSGRITSTSTSRNPTSQTLQSEDNTIATEFIREKSNPAETQGDIPSPEFSREKSNPDESPNDTQSSPDASQEKSKPAASPLNIQSPDFSREKSIPAEGQDNTQSILQFETRRTLRRSRMTL